MVPARLLALAVASVGLAAPLSAGARTATTSTSIVDRTYSCTTFPDTVRKILLTATSGFRDPENKQQWKWPANAELQSHGHRIGYFVAGSLADQAVRAFVLDVDKCNASAPRFLFSTRGLTGFAASQLQDSDGYECVAGARVLLRVRAVFPSPVKLTTRRLFGTRWLAPTASVPAQQLQLAVRTKAGKTVLYASLSETGQSKLFASPRCVSR